MGRSLGSILAREGAFGKKPALALPVGASGHHEVHHDRQMVRGQPRVVRPEPVALQRLARQVGRPEDERVSFVRDAVREDDVVEPPGRILVLVVPPRVRLEARDVQREGVREGRAVPVRSEPRSVRLDVVDGALGEGHLLDATGLARVLEVVLQLRREAGQRQIDDAEVGLAFGWRGVPTTGGAAVVLSN